MGDKARVRLISGAEGSLEEGRGGIQAVSRKKIRSKAGLPAIS